MLFLKKKKKLSINCISFSIIEPTTHHTFKEISKNFNPTKLHKHMNPQILNGIEQVNQVIGVVVQPYSYMSYFSNLRLGIV